MALVGGVCWLSRCAGPDAARPPAARGHRPRHRRADLGVRPRGRPVRHDLRLGDADHRLLLPPPRRRDPPRLAAARLRRRRSPWSKSTGGYSPVTRWIFTAVSLTVVMLFINSLVARRQRADTRARHFFDLSQDMLCTMDMEGRCIEVNAAWQRSLGYRPAEMRGRRLLDLTHPDDHAHATEEAMTGLRRRRLRRPRDAGPGEGRQLALAADQLGVRARRGARLRPLDRRHRPQSDPGRTRGADRRGPEAGPLRRAHRAAQPARPRRPAAARDGAGAAVRVAALPGDHRHRPLQGSTTTPTATSPATRCCATAPRPGTRRCAAKTRSCASAARSSSSSCPTAAGRCRRDRRAPARRDAGRPDLLGGAGAVAAGGERRRSGRPGRQGSLWAKEAGRDRLISAGHSPERRQGDPLTNFGSPRHSGLGGCSAMADDELQAQVPGRAPRSGADGAGRVPCAEARAALRGGGGDGGGDRPRGAGAARRRPGAGPGGALRAVVETIDADELAGLVPQAPRTGVVAIARRKPADLAAVLADPREAPVVLLEQPRNMGNLGACVRVAAAADAAALLTIGENDPWHPDAVRGAAGLHYALPAVAAVERAPSGGGEAAAGARPGGGGDRPGRDRRRAPSSPSAPSGTASATSCWPPPTAGWRCRCGPASPASTWRPRSRRSSTSVRHCNVRAAIGKAALCNCRHQTCHPTDFRKEAKCPSQTSPSANYCS